MASTLVGRQNPSVVLGEVINIHQVRGASERVCTGLRLRLFAASFSDRCSVERKFRIYASALILCVDVLITHHALQRVVTCFVGRNFRCPPSVLRSNRLNDSTTPLLLDRSRCHLYPFLSS